jgi:NurA domain
LLDLHLVVPQIETMARAQAGQRLTLQARLEAGLAQWRAAAAEPDRFARLPRERNEPRLALPTHELLDHRPSAGAPPRRYAAMAVDGSQIEPDFHEIAPCYLINVGHALLRYGPGAEGTRLASAPALFYPEATGVQAMGRSGVQADGRTNRSDGSDPSDPSDPERLSARTPDRLPPDDDVPFGTWGDLDAQRMLAEAEALARLLREESARGEAALAFLDGPLIAWRLDWITPQAAKQAAARNFLRSFSEAKATGIPLAGYISRTRSTDLVNLLKYAACETAVATGSFCAACAAGFRNPSPGHGPRESPCYAAFEGLLDRQLLEWQLPEPGMRSPVFASNSSVLANLYGEHRGIGFFFVNTGGEIGRVELPQWVWEQPERLALVHAMVWDQVTLGRGYPMVLAEAHEQAVVAASERAVFYDLVRRAYGRHDVAAELSAKALRKRGPIA